MMVSAIATLTLSACGGGGGNDGGGGSNPPPPATSVTISGKITFDRIPFKASGSGLDAASPVESPARQVTVEALDGSTVLASTVTDNAGNYSVTVPASRSVKIRAKAEMVKSDSAPTWTFRVRNNTNSNALYALDGEAASSGTSNSTRNLHATSGWGTTSYTGTRAAAPFAILDTVYAAKQLILQAVPTTAFPELDLFWSTTNKDVINTSGNVLLCTNDGQIGTTFYTPDVSNAGNCTANGSLGAGIYILGDFAGGSGDTDEFDQHVIAHEFGHYVEDKFSRADSIGGTHSSSDRLDARVAFGEGWGNGYSGMVLNDPQYRDSYSGITGTTGFSLETDNGNDGWYSEFSVQEILWDLFDSVNDGADTISLGFGPIYSAMTGGQKTTDAFATIYTFADALRAANPSQTAAINALLTGENIATTDIWGSAETNSGGSTTALPIYADLVPNQSPIYVCGSGTDEDRNKLGYRRYLRLNLTTAAALTIQATGAANPSVSGSQAASDPDIAIYRRGQLEQLSQETGASETITQQPLAAGMHIVEVYDYELGPAPHCMTVSAASN